MNRTIISALLISCLTLTACDKDKWWPSTGAKVDLTLNIVSSSPATKTAVEQTDGHTYARWTAGDKLCVFFDGWKDGETPLYEMPNKSESTAHGDFQGFAKDVLDGSHYVYAFAAQTGFQSARADRKILFSIPEVQAPGIGTFDPSADIVVNRAYQQLVNSTDNSITIDDMRFHRILGCVMVSVINKTNKDLSAEKVKKITLESKASGIAFTGSILWDFDSESTSVISANPKVVATLASPISVDSEEKAFILVAPVTLPKGSTLVATLETDHYLIVKTVSLPQDIPFTANKISSLGLNLQESDTVIENL